MSLSVILLIIIILAALVLFSIETLPADVVALAVMLALILSGVLPPDQAFAGFGSDTAMMILGLLLLTTALIKTGVVQLLTRRILNSAGENGNRLYWIITLAVAGLSAFMSNTATAAFFVPITLGISKRLRINASKLLMPLAFAAILSSSVTLVSTSTNLVISGLLSDYGLNPLGMFELTPVGIPILILGLLYMFFIGRHLIPVRKGEAELTPQIGLLAYCSEVVIPKDSSWIGKTLTDLALGKNYDLTVLRILKSTPTTVIPRADTRIEVDDRLLLEGNRDSILSLKQKGNVKFTGYYEGEDTETISRELRLAEVILLPRSPLIGRTLRGLNFRERFGLQVLGIHRKGKTIRDRLAFVRLHIGDQMLIQGDLDTLASLGSNDSFRVVSAQLEASLETKKAPLAVGIFAAVMLLVTFNLLSLPVAVMLGALLVFITRCITPQEAYRSVSWNAWLLIGCMLALGKAMEYTGLAALIADQLVLWLGAANPLLLLSAFFGLSLLLTQPMSNQAAAVVIIPIAIQTAMLLGYNPRTFAVMIAVGASCSYITPLEPACLMVYGPGNYRFMDFVKVGSLLTVIIFSLAILMVPLLWPL
ncbi:MAG: SLC13 family permease [Chloroflexota bacterium]